MFNSHKWLLATILDRADFANYGDTDNIVSNGSLRFPQETHIQQDKWLSSRRELINCFALRWQRAILVDISSGQRENTEQRKHRTLGI